MRVALLAFLLLLAPLSLAQPMDFEQDNGALPLDAKIRGVVRDPAGAPVVDALVGIEGRPAKHGFHTTSRVETAKDGSYTIDVPAGCWAIEVKAPERDPPVGSIEYGFGARDLPCLDVASGSTGWQNVTAPWTGIVRGFVTFPDGSPAQANVHVGGKRAATAADGSYTLALPAGGHAITVHAEMADAIYSSSFAFATRCAEVSPDRCVFAPETGVAWHNVTLPALTSVSLRLQTPAGARILGAEVELATEERSATFDARQGTLLARVPPGKYDLAILPESGGAYTFCAKPECFVVGQGAVDLTITIPGKVNVTGTIRSADGTPMEDVHTKFNGQGGLYAPGSDANGTIKGEGYPGTYEVSILGYSLPFEYTKPACDDDTTPRYAPVHCESIVIPENATNFTFELSLPKTYPARLTVTSGGEASEGVSVEIDGPYWTEAALDASGSATVELPAGNYSLRLEENWDLGHLAYTCEACFSVGPGASAPQTYDVPRAAQIALHSKGLPKRWDAIEMLVVANGTVSVPRSFNAEGVALAPIGPVDVLGVVRAGDKIFIATTSLDASAGETDVDLAFKPAPVLALANTSNVRAYVVEDPSGGGLRLIGLGDFAMFSYADFALDGESVEHQSRAASLATARASATQKTGWTFAFEVGEVRERLALAPPAPPPAPTPTPTPVTAPTPSPTPAEEPATVADVPLAPWVALVGLALVAYARRARR